MLPFEGKRQLKFMGLKTGIVVEQINVRIVQIRYRDSKGRLSKFTSKKKLSVELVMEKKHPHQRFKRFVSKSYGFPLRKRQRPVPMSVFQRKILDRLKKKVKKGHSITAPKLIQNLWSWSYKYYDVIKKSGSKRRKEERVKQLERGKTRKNKMSRPATIRRRVSRTKRDRV